MLNYIKAIKYIFIIFLGACSTIDKEEPIPSYLEISQFKIAQDANLGISDAWIYIDNEFIGVYSLPASVPVLKWGASNLVIKSGIKINGIAATRGIYHFYKDYTLTTDLKAAKGTIVTPQTQYDDSWIDLLYNEDFEQVGISITTLETSDTNMLVWSADKFMGGRCGAVFLDAKHPYYEGYNQSKTGDWFTTPDVIKAAGIFFELNYKSTTEFTIGLTIPTSEQKSMALVTFNPTQEWKKAYVDLSTTLQGYPKGTLYRIFIHSRLASNQSSGAFYLDNLRIVQ